MQSKASESIRTVVPPYILEALATGATVPPAAQAAAQKTLALTTSLRTQREAVAALLLNTTPLQGAGAPNKSRRVYDAGVSVLRDAFLKFAL